MLPFLEEKRVVGFFLVDWLFKLLLADVFTSFLPYHDHMSGFQGGFYDFNFTLTI